VRANLAMIWFSWVACHFVYHTRYGWSSLRGKI